MSEHKGQALGYIVLALGSWTIMRALFLHEASSITSPASDHLKLGSVFRQPKHQRPIASAAVFTAHKTVASTAILMPEFENGLGLPIGPIDQFVPMQISRLRLPKTSEISIPKSATLSRPLAGGFLLLSQAPAPPPFSNSVIAGPAVQAGNAVRRARFYAYSFWRQDGPNNFLNNPDQFGGSQSGFIGEIPLRAFGKRSDELAFIFRGHLVRTDRLQNEIGAGLRWKPSPGVPVHVAIEGRQRANGSNRILAYAVVAPKPVKLARELSAHAYAQLGISSGPDTVRFLDANARIEMPVWESAKAKLVLGPLVSANIQTGSHRVEIGPSVSADMAIGETRLRLSADWRSQIAGDVARASGPAITVSMSF